MWPTVIWVRTCTHNVSYTSTSSAAILQYSNTVAREVVRLTDTNDIADGALVVHERLQRERDHARKNSLGRICESAHYTTSCSLCRLVFQYLSNAYSLPAVDVVRRSEEPVKNTEKISWRRCSGRGLARRRGRALTIDYLRPHFGAG